MEYKTSLTSAEITNLWSAYLNNSMASCVLSYFQHCVEDAEIRPIVDLALEISKKNLSGIKEIFKFEQYPIPVGFSMEDVNLKAGKLYSDAFFLKYIHQMCMPGYVAYGLSNALSARSDVEQLFAESLRMNIELCQRSKKLMLDKGIYIRAPYIPYPSKVDFVEKAGFLTGWFGERKALLAQEIMHLYHNINTNFLGKALIMGFAQVAKSEDARDFFKRGKEISGKQIEVFSTILIDEDIPVPMAWDSEVLDNTEAPFSDKLMMFHINALNANGIGNYGAALAVSTRRDLMTHFVRLTAEIGQYAEDGLNLMIKHGWLEEPPQAANRAQLIKK